MDMTRDEAQRQLDAMMLLAEPWTPEQWQQAKQLHQLIIGPGMVCFDGPLSARWSYELWTLPRQREQRTFAASIEAMPAMSLADFKREVGASGCAGRVAG